MMPAARCRTTPVSPPTRGWTLIAEPLHLAGHGFPAHAGMDLAGISRASASRGFPRPRGDGPLMYRSWWPAIGVSPPTRGWTVSEDLLKSIETGFPAHAGMDLVIRTSPSTEFGFPRPRGDGPHRTGVKWPTGTVSPPTRGWTVIQESVGTTVAGFPAHAGMDRSPDGAWRTSNPVSPPTRGWTLLGAEAASTDQVSPPTRGWTVKLTDRRPWFPRPRGDGP